MSKVCTLCKEEKPLDNFKDDPEIMLNAYKYLRKED